MNCRKWLISDESRLNNFLHSLPSEDAVQQAASQSKTAISEDSDSDKEMKDEPLTESTPQKTRAQQLRMVTDEDGWTTVLPRK